MLSRMRPAQMDELEAFDNVTGIGDERLLTILANGFARLILAWSGDKDATVEDAKKLIDPWLARGE